LRKLIYIAIISFFEFFVQNSSNACFCGSHYSGINNFGATALTIPAETLPRGKFALGYALNYQDYDSFSFNYFKEVNRKQIHSHSLDALLTQSVNMAYGVSDDLSLIVNLPFQSFMGLDSTAEGLRVDDGNSVGIGDISVFAKYKFLEKNHFSAAVIAGIKIPSGHKEEKNEFGFLLGPDSQPGSGSWDPLVGLAVSKAFDDFALHSNVLYKFSTQGAQDTNVGDSLNFNLGASKSLDDGKLFSRQVLPTKILGQRLSWDLLSEANGIWREKVETNGVKDPNHGGLIIMLTPGFRVSINERIYNTVFMSFPIFQELNGVQSDLAFQLGFNTSLVF
jgi:hypothetical protein